MLDSDFPLSLIGQPLGLLYLLPGAKVLIYVVLSCHALPVLSNLCSLSELFRPLGIGCKAGLIGVRGDVTSNAWVSVFEPCASLGTGQRSEIEARSSLTYHVRILIVYSQVKAWQFGWQEYTGSDSCNTSTDDPHLDWSHHIDGVFFQLELGLCRTT